MNATLVRVIGIWLLVACESDLQAADGAAGSSGSLSCLDRAIETRQCPE